MRRDRLAPFLVPTLFVVGPSLVLAVTAGQTPTTGPPTGTRTALVPQVVARQHLAKRVAPPPLPQLPQGFPPLVPGMVYVDVQISPNGRVAQTRALCGSGLDRDRVESAVRQWEFQPFTSAGQPVSARAVISELARPAGIGEKELATLAPFGDAMLMCKLSIDSRDAATSEKTCQELAAMADQRLNRLEQVCAAQLLAWSHINAGRLDEAIKEADRAVSKLSLAYDDRTEAVREAARVRDRAGRHDEAVSQYGKTVNELRETYKNSPSEVKAIATVRLKNVLAEYADLLERAGNADEARKVREERDMVK